MQHYVYLLASRVREKYYIGCRSYVGLIGDDTYKGSATAMTKEDKDNCNKIILKRFTNRQDAVAYEIELHNEFDVGVNPLFWNKAKQTSVGFDTTGIEPCNKGKGTAGDPKYRTRIYPHLTRAEVNKLTGKMRRGRKASEESKRKMSESSRINHYESIPVMCVDTKEVFESACSAGRDKGIDPSSIRKCCKDNRKMAGGFKWSYPEEESNYGTD